jgi:hypothetical protein
MRRTLITIGVVLALSGCGSSAPSTAQIRHCWSHAISSYAQQKNDALAIANDRTGNAIQRALTTTAEIYEQAGSLPAGYAFNGEVSWLKSTQQKCGKLP